MPDANWMPVITLLIGFFTGTFTEWLRGFWVAKREKLARDDSQRARIEERRVAFQRQNLLDLQTAVMDCARAAGKAHFADTMKFRETGTWRNDLLPAEINEEWRTAQMRTTLLTVRIADKGVREWADRFKNELMNLALSDERRRSETGMSSMAGIMESLNERIGEVLRKFDEEEVALNTR